MRRPWRIPGDWFDGDVPANAEVHPQAHLESAITFQLCDARLPDAVRIGRGSGVYAGTMFDLGPDARVEIGEHVLLNGARIICDAAVSIGSFTLISWRVVLMDTRRVPLDPAARRLLLGALPEGPQRRLRGTAPAAPIAIESNVWIGFDAVVLPGVRIGRGSIVGARSVVAADVPPFTVVAGNPARHIRALEPFDGPLPEVSA